VQLSGLALKLGAKPNGCSANELNDGVCRIDRVQRSIRTDGGVADVLQVGPDATGVEVYGNDIVLLVQHEHETLLGIGTEGSFDWWKLVSGFPWRRVERLDIVKPGHATLAWDPHYACARHPSKGCRSIVGGQFRLASTPSQSGAGDQHDDFGIHGWKIAGRRASGEAGKIIFAKY
jgi:hypothetical protein